MKDVFLEQLTNTRDMTVYTDMLGSVISKYTIIVCVKEQLGKYCPDSVLENLKKLGFSGISKDVPRAYAGICSKCTVLFDKSGGTSEERICFEDDIGSIKFDISSLPINHGNAASIMIGETEYSLNGRGVNIVVFDCERSELVDSVTYDACIPSCTMYHKNPKADDRFFDEHFFLPEKYKSVWQEPYRKKYSSNRRVGVNVFANAIIEPLRKISGRECGGVCDENYKFIAGHENYIFDAKKNDRHICDCYKLSDPERPDRIDETVIWGGVMIDHPGHLLVETFPERMWWVCKNREINYRVAIIIKGKEQSARFIEEFCELVDLPTERILIVKKPTQFSEVIVPDQSEWLYLHTTPYEVTDEFKAFYDDIRKKLTPGPYKKVYLTKRKTQRANVIGEDYFIDFYKQRGFEIIDPEDYTIKEKAEIMYGADEVVSPVGTNTLFSIFCKPTVKLTTFTRIKCQNLFSQNLAVETAGIEEVYVVNTDAAFLQCNEFVFGLAMMCVTDDFVRYCQAVLGETLSITPEESLKENTYKYLKYCPEYYTHPHCFELLKNQNMQTVLQNISEVFCGKDFDTTGLNLSTDSVYLKNQIKQLTSDLEASKKLVGELEGTDVYKSAKLLESLNDKFEKQFCEFRDTFKVNHAQQTKIDELTSRIAELEKLLTKANNTVETQTEELKSKQSENNELSAQLQQAQKNNSELIEQVSAFERSKSWKITRPFRAISRVFRKEK